jgi:hypothetical protein
MPAEPYNAVVRISLHGKKFPSPGACLREAASAKAGEGTKGRGPIA